MHNSNIDSVCGLALSPGSPIFFNVHKVEGEPGMQCYIHDVGPYTRVRRVVDCGNCVWMSHIFSSTPVRRGWKIWCQRLQASVVGSLKASNSCVDRFEIDGCWPSLFYDVMPTFVMWHCIPAPPPLFSCMLKNLGAWGRGYMWVRPGLGGACCNIHTLCLCPQPYFHINGYWTPRNIVPISFEYVRQENTEEYENWFYFIFRVIRTYMVFACYF